MSIEQGNDRERSSFRFMYMKGEKLTFLAMGYSGTVIGVRIMCVLHKNKNIYLNHLQFNAAQKTIRVCMART